MPFTHALFLGNEFLGEVTPNALNLYSSERLVPLPSTYYTKNYAWGWSGRTPVEDPARVEAMLIPQVKAANEALVKARYSQNYGKQKKYSRKQQEVIDFRSLNGALGLPVANALTASLALFVPGLNGMTAAQQKKKFRFAMMQAAKRGVTVDVIIGEIEATLDAVEDQVAAWEAVELEAIRAIKAATTADAKRNAFAVINWNWTPAI
jgi:hypothetical protein